MTPYDECRLDTDRLDPAQAAALFVEHGGELRSFLMGVLRDADLAGDALQRAFVKLLEQGHTAQHESLKAWLFRVAYHEALLVRRRDAVEQRATERLVQQTRPPAEDAAAIWIRAETVHAVRQAVADLPESQQAVVRLRIYEQMKFADVAAELGLPLGTVLARMRAALLRLKKQLES